ncbi:hypothetical protein THAOC_22529, partial [Thalassiosira oceanica]
MSSAGSGGIAVPQLDIGHYAKGLNTLRIRVRATICVRTAETYATSDMTQIRQEREMERRLHGTTHIASQFSLFTARSGVY